MMALNTLRPNESGNFGSKKIPDLNSVRLYIWQSMRDYYARGLFLDCAPTRKRRDEKGAPSAFSFSCRRTPFAPGTCGKDERAGGERAGGEKAGGERAGGERAGGERAGGEKAGGEKAPRRHFWIEKKKEIKSYIRVC